MNDKAKSILKTAGYIISPASVLLSQVLYNSISNSSKVADNGTLDELKMEAEREELKCRISEAQAKISQELAIAQRIENAKEVEIEVFYDTSGEGKAGVSVDQSSNGMNIGVAGNGRKIVKKIYHFNGFSNQSEDTQINEDKNNN